MKTIFLLLSILFLLQYSVTAQVGINNSNPDSTSVFDLQSNSKGLLIPRMGTNQRNSMATNGNVPAHSLLVFDINLNKFFFYDNTYSKWLMLNPWYGDGNNNVSYGETNTSYQVNIYKPQGANLFKVHTSFSGISSDSLKFQSEFLFDDSSIPSSGIKFNAKIGGGDFILMKAYYNNHPVMTLKNSGNLGLGITNPSKKLEISGNAKASGEVSGAKFIGKGTIPIGGIIMWSGNIGSIPSGWALCDGNNGTPNLKDRFIAGGGGSYAISSIGGADAVSISTAQMPYHNHSGTTNTESNHYHKVVRDASKNGGGNSIARHSDQDYSIQYNLQRHSSTANWGNTNSDGAHDHTLNINNTGSGQAHENRPPYYALAFIMRTN